MISTSSSSSVDVWNTFATNTGSLITTTWPLFEGGMIFILCISAALIIFFGLGRGAQKATKL